MLRREDGQTMAEYGVTLGVIVPALIIAFGLLGGRISQLVERAAGLLP